MRMKPLLALILLGTLCPWHALAASPDPYEAEYADVHEALRYPERISWRGNQVVFDNFRTGRVVQGVFEPAWSRVTLDLSKIESVSFMLCIFAIGPYPAGHTQMVFTMAPGGCVTDAGECRGLVASFEAFRGRGEGYSAFAGLRDTYRSIWVLGSQEDAFDKAQGSYTSIELLELELTREKRRELLRAFLARGLAKKSLQKTWYHTTRNSCVTNQFDVLGEVFAEQYLDRAYPTTSIPRKAPNVVRCMGFVRRSYRLTCPDEFLRWRQTGVVPRHVGAAPEPDGLTYEDVHQL